MASNKDFVVSVVSDAKGFINGIETALKMIETATSKVEGFEKLTEDGEQLKQQIIVTRQELQLLEKDLKSGTSVSDDKISQLENKIDNLQNKFDSFRHTFKSLQDVVNGLSESSITRINNRINDTLLTLKGIQEQVNLIQKASGAFLSNNVDIKDISNIGQLEKSFKDALSIYEDYSSELKKDKLGNYTQSYLIAAENVYKYARALQTVEDIYLDNKGDTYFSEEFDDTVQDAYNVTEKIIKDRKVQINKLIQDTFSNINIGSFFKEATGTIEKGSEGVLAKGLLTKGTIEIPVRLQDHALTNLETSLGEIVGRLKSYLERNPIELKIDFNKETLNDDIKSYFSTILNELKKQTEAMNKEMSEILTNTGIKDTQKNYEGLSTAIPTMLAKVTDFAKDLKTATTDLDTALTNLNSSMSPENVNQFADSIKQVAEDFKLLVTSLDDVSSKLSGNGLEGQFDLIKKKFNEFSFSDNNEKEIDNKKKLKELNELFSLYTTYQKLGGIRPIKDVFVGEENKDKIKAIKEAYKNYEKSKKNIQGDQEKPEFIIDQKQLDGLLNTLNSIKQLLEGISKINFSELKELFNSSLNNNVLNIDLKELKQISNEIYEIINMLSRGFNIPTSKQLNAQFLQIKKNYEKLPRVDGKLDIQNDERIFPTVIAPYYNYQQQGGTRNLASIIQKEDIEVLSQYYQHFKKAREKNNQLKSQDTKQELGIDKEDTSEIIKMFSKLNEKTIEVKGSIEQVKQELSQIAELTKVITDGFTSVYNIPQKINLGLDYTGKPEDSLKILTELEKKMPPVEEGFTRIIHLTQGKNINSIFSEGLHLPSADLSQHALSMKQYADDAEKMAKGMELTFNTLGVLGSRGNNAIVLDIPTNEVRGYCDAVKGLDTVSSNYVRGSLDLGQSIITLNDNFGKTTTTIEAFAEAVYKARQEESLIKKENNTPVTPQISRSESLIKGANQIFGEDVFSSYYEKYEKAQQEVEDTGSISSKTSQDIIDAIDRVKNSLADIIGELNNLNQTIVNISETSNTIDYSTRISNIKRGITDLNNNISSLGDTLNRLNFDKINNFTISEQPFNNIIQTLYELIHLIERVTGFASDSTLDSKFKGIKSLYNSMVNEKGNFIVRGNKDKLQELYKEYFDYKNSGGNLSLSRLTDSASNKSKLYKYYDQYLEQNTKASVNEINNEKEALKQVEETALNAAESKKIFSEENQKVAQTAEKSAEEIKSETQSMSDLNKNLTGDNTIGETQQVTDLIVQGQKEIQDEVDNTNQKLIEQKTTLDEILGKDRRGYFNSKEEEDKVSPQLPAVLGTRSLATRDVEKVESEVVRDELALQKIYEEEKRNYEEGKQSWQEAWDKLKKRFEDLYNSQGFNHTKSTFNLDDQFNLKDITISRKDPNTKNTITDKYVIQWIKTEAAEYIEQLKRENKLDSISDDEYMRLLQEPKLRPKFVHSNIQVVDNEEQRINTMMKDASKYEKQRQKIEQWIASFNNKTSNNFTTTQQMKNLINIPVVDESTLKDAEKYMSELETLYNEVVNNARRGASSLSPIPNMMFGQESVLTKMQKAFSSYDKMTVKWDTEDDTKKIKNVEEELNNLKNLYDELQKAINEYNTTDENGNRVGNIEAVSKAYGDFNEQLNRVNNQISRIKTVNTEINGNQIKKLTQWFSDLQNPNAQGAAELGKIDSYTDYYNRFAMIANEIQNLTTNLNIGDSDYNTKKQQIHELTLELEELKKTLSSDAMNIQNTTGEVIQQNLPSVTQIEELNKVVDEYAEKQGRIVKQSREGLITDKDGNQFITFSRSVQLANGTVKEFEFTYNKAMGTVSVATKKIESPESAFKTFADELNTKWRGFFTTLASFTSLYRLWGYFKQGISTIREFDTALTEMQKVSDETIYTLQRYQTTTFETARSIGASALQVQQSTADFMRLGESLEEAAKSAKAANVLMNVSEFQSIDEATKSLIAMGAAYDDLSKMNIIDKLNEIGNNYAISTSEAATALQSSASALKTANNDMDEALALVTAGNAVIQDASKVGTGMRTIALRLTGTKSAKEELEELGEDTDAMLTTQSKLRQTIMEATAVEANNFKGFDILDNNGNYKSTYEIMLGIAEIYNDILEADKKFGRNNANLLLETVAGKVRANIAASIFQNPDVLKRAYQSSQEASGSAMEENEKYMASIAGHIAQIQTSWQELWTNTANRDFINYFIDLGNSLVQTIDKIGLFKTALIGIMGLKTITGLMSGQGLATSIVRIIGLFDGETDKTQIWGQAINILNENFSESIKTGTALGKMFGGLKNLLWNPTGWAIGGSAIAIGLYINYLKELEQKRKEQMNNARSSAEQRQEENKELNEQINSYEELKRKLDSNILSEEEEIQIKQQILDIQNSITEKYGDHSDQLNLINGELKTQLNILKQIKQEEANTDYVKNREGYQAALEEYTKNRVVSIDSIQIKSNNIKKILTDAGFKDVLETVGDGLGEIYTSGATGTVEEIISAYESAQKNLQDYVLDLDPIADADELKEANNQLNKISANLTQMYQIRDDNKTSALFGLREGLWSRQIISQDIISRETGQARTGYDILTDLEEASDKLADAFMRGDYSKIDELREKFIELQAERDQFLEVDINSPFAILFDQINEELLETQFRTYDAQEAIDSLFGKKAISRSNQFADNLNGISKYVNALKKRGFNRVDIQNMFATDIVEDYERTVKGLMHALGFAEGQQADFINLLVSTGIITGDLSDVTNEASQSYNEFSQAVAKGIENVSALQSVMSESVSGKGISTQNIEAFRKMYSDYGIETEQALERTANGYHVNERSMYQLNEQYKSMLHMQYADALNDQYNALQKVNEEYQRAVANGADLSGYAAQKDAIYEQIQSLDDLMMQYQSANSAYQQWLTAQSGNGTRDMYDSIYGGYDTIKEEIEHGWAGSDKVRSWLDLIYNDEGDNAFNPWIASVDQLNEKFKEVTKTIEGTGGKSIADFFTVDENGKSTSLGVFNFFDAVLEKQKEVGREFVRIGENGEYIFDFDKNGDYQIADLLGIDVEAVQAILRAAYDAGFTVNLDQPIYSIERLRDVAEEAKESLNFNIDLDTDNIEQVDSDLERLQEYRDVLAKDQSIPMDVKTEKLEELDKLIQYAIAHKRELIEKSSIDFSTNIDDVNDKIKKLQDNLKKRSKQTNWDLPDGILDTDISAIENPEELQKIEDKIRGFMNLHPELDNFEVEYLNELLDAILEKKGLLENPTPVKVTVSTIQEAEKGIGEINKELQLMKYYSDQGFDVEFSDEFKHYIDVLRYRLFRDKVNNNETELTLMQNEKDFISSVQKDIDAYRKDNLCEIERLLQK